MADRACSSLIGDDNSGQQSAPRDDHVTRKRIKSGDSTDALPNRSPPRKRISIADKQNGHHEVREQLLSPSTASEKTNPYEAPAEAWTKRSKITFIAVINLFVCYCSLFIPTHLAPHPRVVVGISITLLCIIAVQFLLGPGGGYGKFGDSAVAKFIHRFGTLPLDIAWATMEQPSFIVPVLYISWGILNGQTMSPGVVFLGLFMIHYFHRSYVYPWLLRGRPYMLFNWCAAVTVTTMNGTMQSLDLLYGGHYEEWSIVTSPRALIGYFLFFFGMLTNIHSDYILRNLRQPGDTGYKIPRGGMFEYISGANTWGESIEWTGYAIASGSLAATTFSVFCWAGIGMRTIATHNWYLEKFKEEYPKQRKRLIPFIW